jgi:DNA-binding CsgD family transcriptional regulator
LDEIVVENRKNEVPERVEVRDDKRDAVFPEAAGSSEPGGRDDGAPSATTTRDLAVRGLAAVGVALWCVSVLAIGVNLAESAWEWAWIFGFGTVVPALFLWQVGRLLTPGRGLSLPSAKDQEKELLKALAERGEITPINAALRTSLTADEAADMLDKLAGKGHLQLRVEEGIQSYALREPDRRGLPGTPGQTAAAAGLADAEAPLPLDEPLSERELEVLALLASGRTNREIARDLFVTVGTIKTHTSNIYGKLGARNRADALAKARNVGLLK